jgi:hypothetical protein
MAWLYGPMAAGASVVEIIFFMLVCILLSFFIVLFSILSPVQAGNSNNNRQTGMAGLGDFLFWDFIFMIFILLIQPLRGYKKTEMSYGYTPGLTRRYSYLTPYPGFLSDNPHYNHYNYNHYNIQP